FPLPGGPTMMHNAPFGSPPPSNGSSCGMPVGSTVFWVALVASLGSASCDGVLTVSSRMCATHHSMPYSHSPINRLYLPSPHKHAKLPILPPSPSGPCYTCSCLAWMCLWTPAPILLVLRSGRCVFCVSAG